MPWGERLLNDGGKIPEIAFGTWTAGSGLTVIQQVEQAIDVGFNHIDTAQVYRNETETGTGIRESGLARKDLYLTTKWSGLKGMRQSINDSLTMLGVKSVDLYLIHHPRICNGDVAGTWREFLELKKEGRIKSAGVSNFKIEDLEEIRKAGLEMPSVNQILLHPYVYAQTAELLNYHEKYQIVTEAWSPLYPLTHKPGGPIDRPLKKLSEKFDVDPSEILFAWGREKGAVIVTTSRQKTRLEGYLHAGDITLTQDEIASIDDAGRNSYVLHLLKTRGWLALIYAGALAGLEYMRVANN